MIFVKSVLQDFAHTRGLQKKGYEVLSTTTITTHVRHYARTKTARKNHNPSCY